MKKIFAVVLSLAVLVGWLLSARPATAQQPLERLEGQIRSQTVPAEGAQQAPKLQATGNRAYLGAVVDDKNDRGRGVRVLSVRPGGPADLGGLRPQDLITAGATARVRQMSDLTAILDMMSPGDKLPMEVLRDGQTQKVDVTLGRHPGAAELPRPGVVEGVPQPPSGAIAPPSQTVPPPAGPTLTPNPGIGGPMSDSARLEQLQHRVEQLERRVQELEQALAESRKKP